MHAGVGIRPVRVTRDADIQDHPIDVDGVHLRDAVAEGRGGVVSGAGTDDQRVCEGPSRELAVHLAEVRWRERRGRQILVRDAVDRDLLGPIREGLKTQPVVGRPVVALREVEETESEDARKRAPGHRCGSIDPRAEGQQSQENHEHREPRERRRHERR